MNYDLITTDALLEGLPDHLLLVRNSNADAGDKWRVYNIVTREFIPLQARTAREAIINLLKGMKK